MKKLIRLTEGELHKIINNSVKRAINEIGDTKRGKDAISQVQGRAAARATFDPSHANQYQKIHDDAKKRLKGYENGKEFQKGFQKGMMKPKATNVREAKNDDIENGIEGQYDDYLDDDEYNDYLGDLNDKYNQERDEIEADQYNDYDYDDHDPNDNELYNWNNY